ncbi:beta-defensin 6 precursor [Mus musculus]|uniref:Beta-defensin 6 n=3 Tax=Mus TaxID=862507 RepID=DEFB6_MOUSE|nr:beta-defensin 6 precursor [Mus musculus]Q91VD6.1 RecName: Full=Beta-defensin 6; Short=BD-6; Short=mBD-6; AltName: Full=Defensin, beta 6; Flags: Precursor [Mus musculus]AAI19423.1 Defensin beta 6 [Mus musculus]AAI19424.1 Defensin beta 6 [Mus musculus]AAI41872.1 Defensin beta 6 [Mus musculus]AAI41873.1 Defensin beta 6 [Mus musculus]EDL22233.1 defensin beta 6 [Mus musculus]|eukprot:NP_473415.1 beta-defensin 6 precursor [Mus musculus]
MKIHYLLFAFILVMLSPLAAFSQLINSPVTCMSYGGSCQRSCNGGFRLGGHCGHPKIRCCRRK